MANRPTNDRPHVNEVHLGGLLARDPANRTTATGKRVASITIATTYKQRTEYHRVVCWENLAEKVRGFKKGSFIEVIGRLQTRTWEDANKTKHYTTEIVAFEIVTPGQERARRVEITDADIPF